MPTEVLRISSGALQGTISDKKLEYAGKYYGIGATAIPMGAKVLLHIWGRNDTDTNQKLGLTWTVKDPDGTIIEHGADWESWHTGPGGTHHFISDYFYLTKRGVYYLGTTLFMNPESPVVVDSYRGNLCTIAAPYVAGKIEDPRIKYNLSYVGIPQSVPFGENFRIAFTGRNTSDINLKLNGGITVIDPDGNYVYQETDWETYHTGPNGTHDFSFPIDGWRTIPVNKYGTWRAIFELHGWDGATTTFLDRVEADIFTVPRPELTGIIENPRIKYNLSYVAIPVDNMPYGENFRIAFYGRNTSDINLTLSADIRIYDPDGRQVFYEEDWETGWTGPGGTHNFKWPKSPLATIPVNKVGIWKARMRLFCDIGEPAAELLDDVTEVIFTVVAPVFEGRITDKKVDWTDLPGGEVDFPMTEPAPFGERIRVSFLGWNDSTTTMRLSGEVWIYDPDKKLFYHAEDVSTLAYSPGTAHKFIFPKPPLATDKLNKAGDWTIRIELTGGGYLLAEYEGPLFTVEAPEKRYLGRIASVLVDLKPRWPGGEHSVPYTEEAVPIGQKYHISFEGYNESDFWMRLKGMVWIISPTGREYYLDDVSAASYSPGTAHEFIFQQFPAVDEEGPWAIRIELRNSTGEFLLDEFEDTLFIGGALPEAFGSIGGRVTDAKTGDPIEGAVVWVAGQSGSTDSSGDYIIADVPVGTWTAAAGAEGYESAAKESIGVSEGVTTTVDFVLEPSKVGIPDWLIVGGAIGGLAAAAGGLYYYEKKRKIKT